MKVAIIIRKYKARKKKHRLAYYLKNQMMEKEVTVNLIDLKNYPLPVFGSAISEEQTKSVEEIGSTLKSSQAVIIVTPEYHSNISAALNNALEYCGMSLIGKVTGIASASATQFGGVQASNTLQITLLNLGAYPVSRRLLVPEIHLAFNQDNEPVRTEIKEQVEKFLNEMLSYANAIQNKVSLTPA